MRVMVRAAEAYGEMASDAGALLVRFMTVIWGVGWTTVEGGSQGYGSREKDRYES
jgi:hypothetical protein